MKIPQSLIGRLVTVQSILTGATWVFAAIIAALVLRYEIDVAFDENLKRHTHQLLVLSSHEVSEIVNADPAIGPDVEDIEFVLELQESDATHEFIILGQTRRQLVFPKSGKPYEIGEPFPLGFFSNKGLNSFSALDEETGFGVVAMENDELRSAVWRESILWLLLPLLALLPILAYFVNFTARSVMHPIVKLEKRISELGSNNLEPLNLGKQPTELVPIVDEIERLTENLKLALDSERLISAENSHELRTPIAGALAQIQALSPRLKNKEQKEMLSKAEDAIQHLSRLSDSFLQLSRTDAGFAQPVTKVSLAPVIDMVLDEPAFKDCNQELLVVRSASTDLAGYISEDAFAVVLRNLLQNARNYSDKDKPIELEILSNGISVKNSCSIVDKRLLKQLSKKFIRGESKRIGSGLGLSIASSILDSCGGELQLFSPIKGRDDGFEARVTLSKQPGNGLR